MPNKKAKKIEQHSQGRADLIAGLLDKFEELVDKYSSELTQAIIEAFVNKLSADNGKIITDEDNLRKIALVDKAWNTFQSQQGVNIISTFITDLNSITDENLKYYRTLSDAQIRPGDITNIINSRLGIDDNGNPIKGGYVQSLMDDVSVRNDIKNLAYQKVTSGTGFADLSTSLKNYVEGNSESAGAFKQYYRDFAFDTYTHIDRLNGALYAEKLNLKYFIFQGTRRKASRYFCIQRKGQVFSTDEAEEWRNLIGKRKEVEGDNGKKKSILIGPIVEDAAGYNPIIDLGGIGCVDIASFISEEVAFQFRPELKAQ